MAEYKYTHVLIIDDSEMDLMLNKMILTTVHFAQEIQTLNSGSKALSFLRDCIEKEPGRFPQCIFLDINMPELSGFDFLIEYQQLPDKFRKTCKVVMISSSEDSQDIAEAGKFKDVVGYLVKPLEIDKINTF